MEPYRPLIEKRVDEYMRQNGLSQNAMAARMGIDRSHFSKLLRGEIKLTAHWLAYLIRARLISEGELVSEVKPNKEQADAFREIRIHNLPNGRALKLVNAIEAGLPLEELDRLIEKYTKNR